MKIPPLKNTARRCCALALTLALCVPPAFAAREHDLLETPYELPGGLTYTNYVSQYSAGRLESYVLELEEDEDVFPILLQSSGTVYGAATINAAVTRAQAMGYRVLAAVNTDFFSTATGVPEGIVVEDGVYKSEGSGTGLLITDNAVALCEDTAVSLSLTDQATGRVLTPHHFNKYRASSGGVYLLNGDFSGVSTRTTEPGWFVRLKLVDYDPENPDFLLTVNSELTLEVTELIPSARSTSIGPGEYILTASEASGWGEIFDRFALGDRLTLTTACEDEALSDAQWACGTGDVLIRGGRITDAEEWDDSYRTSRAPRTALGMRRDGTLVLYAVDGRQADLSSGLTMASLAEAMDELDCRWAVNLDGGGSTTASVWLPGQSAPAIQNSPSDGKPRPGGTYLLLVTMEEASGRPDALALTENGLTVLTGSALPLPDAVVLDEWLTVLDEELDDLKITSRKGLGDVEDGVYYADKHAGTEKLRLRSRDLGSTGEAVLHVVDELTELTLLNAATGEAVTALTVLPGDEIALTAAGSYHGRPALRGLEGTKLTVDEELAHFDEDTGLLTFHTYGSSEEGLVLKAGGMTVTLPLTVLSPHGDVDEDHWAFEAVEYCYENGIVSGISDTEFGVDGHIRRADFMLMLYGALGRPEAASPCTFTDVAETDYFFDALSWAQHAGLISGVGDGSCAALSSITREQAFTILRRALPLFGNDCPDAPLGALAWFDDWEDLSEYARIPAATLAAQEIIGSEVYNLEPRRELTRGEMAVLLFNTCTREPLTDYEGLFPEIEVPELPVPSEPEAPTPEQPEAPGEEQPSPENPEPEQPTVPETPEPEQPTVPETPEPEQPAAEEPPQPEEPAPEPQQPALDLPAGWLYARVTNAELGLNVRSGPGTDREVLTKLPNDTLIIVLESLEGWKHVLYVEEGAVHEGYISADYAAIPEQTGTVTAEPTLNLRSGPSGEHEGLAKLPTGTAVTVLNSENGWYQVRCNDLTGWVSGAYISLSLS